MWNLARLQFSSLSKSESYEYLYTYLTWLRAPKKDEKRDAWQSQRFNFVLERTCESRGKVSRNLSNAIHVRDARGWVLRFAGNFELNLLYYLLVRNSCRSLLFWEITSVNNTFLGYYCSLYKDARPRGFSKALWDFFVQKVIHHQLISNSMELREVSFYRSCSTASVGVLQVLRAKFFISTDVDNVKEILALTFRALAIRQNGLRNWRFCAV